MWMVLVVLCPLQTSSPILVLFPVLLLASQSRYRVGGDGGVDHNGVIVPPERFDAILVKAA